MPMQESKERNRALLRGAAVGLPVGAALAGIGYSALFASQRSNSATSPRR